jgi:protein TonB
MFDMYLPEKGAHKKAMRKTLTFFLSVLIHATLIIAVIIVPLLRAEADLPGFKFIKIMVAPPVVPGIPPGRTERRGSGPAGPTNGPKNPPPTSKAHGFMAPMEIPTKIIDENLADLVPNEPGGDGVVGSPGIGPGDKSILGKDIPSEEIKPFEREIWVIRSPQLIKRVKPIYSATALAAHVSGPVVISAVTDIYGRVRDTRIVSGHPLLSASALEAIRQWIYEPYLVNGIPKPVKFTVTITFVLETR